MLSRTDPRPGGPADTPRALPGTDACPFTARYREAHTRGIYGAPERSGLCPRTDIGLVLQAGLAVLPVYSANTGVPAGYGPMGGQLGSDDQRPAASSAGRELHLSRSAG